jgi:hypothetical protein
MKVGSPRQKPSGGALLEGNPTGYVMQFILRLNDDTVRAVDDSMRTAIEFWQGNLKEKNLPSPFGEL